MLADLMKHKYITYISSEMCYEPFLLC